MVTLWFLGHNLWTINARKSIKCSKDSDSSLVSNENLSKILPSGGCALGQVTWSKMAKNLAHLWRHTQNWKPQFFFIADSKTCQVFWGFEQLYSTEELPEIYLISGRFPSTIYSYAGNQGVKCLGKTTYTSFLDYNFGQRVNSADNARLNIFAWGLKNNCEKI